MLLVQTVFDKSYALIYTFSARYICSFLIGKNGLRLIGFDFSRYIYIYLALLARFCGPLLLV